MTNDKDFEKALDEADETLISQGIDPADLEDPAKEKLDLAENIENKK